MSSARNTPPFVLAAARRIYSLLPKLVGDDWSQIAGQVDAHLKAIEANPDNYLASTQLFGLLAQYDPARQRLSQELLIQEIVVENICEQLSEMQLNANDPLLATTLSVLSWEVDADTLPAITDSHRTITMKPGGENAISIKFQNLDIDLPELLTMGATFLAAGDNMMEKPRPFIIAAGVIGMIAMVYSQMKVEIKEQEATVFWGMIQATGSMSGAGLRESTILEATNTERTEYGLDALTEKQMRASLIKLEQLKSIEKSGDTYRIIERYTVKR